MRQQLSLVLTASFLFLSQGAMASTINNADDNGSVAQGVGGGQVTFAVSSATSSTSDAQPDTRSLIQKTRQLGNITGLNFLEQTVFLEWLSAAPVERHLLLQTCRYYRAFVMPILGETHFIEPALRKDLLISIIAGQTGDVALFFRDQRTTLEQCSILELKDAIASGYYNGVLSQKTEHGQTYRSIGPESVRDVLGDNGFIFRGNDLRLVPLNFSGAERITNLDLSQNQLKALDLSKQTALHILFLYNNQLKALDLSQQTALRNLSLSKNQLKVLDLSQQTALENLFLYNNHLEALTLSQQTMLTWLDLSHNQLKELDLSQLMALVSVNVSDNQLKELDLSQQTALERLDLSKNQLTTLSGLGGMGDFRALALDLDAELLRCDQNLLTTLIDLNAQRDEYSKIYLQAWSKDANGIMSYKRINLD